MLGITYSCGANRDRVRSPPLQAALPKSGGVSGLYPARKLVPAAEKAGIGRIGWHTFRHTYSTLLRSLKVDVKVQQELLRHADICTTMNVYMQAIPEDLRAANSRVVRLVLSA